MSRVWGRLVKASLSNSKKLAKCSERNALIYNFTLTQHDGEGRLEVDDASMLSMCKLFAIEHDWTRKDMAVAREELGRVGLWRLYETKDGQHCAEVVDWENAQRVDRIRRGSKILDELEAGGKSVGSPLEAGGKSVGSGTDKRAIEEKRTETNKREEREPTRAREEQDSIQEKTRSLEEIGCSTRQEWTFVKDLVFADFRKALGSPHWKSSRIDLHAGERSSGFLGELPDRIQQFKKAIRIVRDDGKPHPHLFADCVQLLLVGLPTNGRAHSPDLLLPTVPDWIVEARAKGWK